ncbi:hypothetical protein MKX01_000944 [Papaver californicum]|nr:hypothetical protein MKX01_000944 [Papaver californicum]
MYESDIRFSKFTLSSVLKGCASLGNAREGQIVHTLAIKIGTELDGILISSLVDMYSKCGLAEAAQKASQGEKALECFRQMQREGVNPNEFTLATCLRGCSTISALESGRQLHSQFSYKHAQQQLQVAFMLNFTLLDYPSAKSFYCLVKLSVSRRQIEETS